MIDLSLLPLAEVATRSVFEWGRIESSSDWILPIFGFLAILGYVILMYVLDAPELHPVVAVLLAVFRVLAFVGLLVLFLQPQWRTEREVVHNSRVLLMVDTSSSMGLADAAGASSPRTASRAEQVVSALEQTDLLQKLRKTQDVVVVKFDEDLKRVVSLSKLAPEGSAAENPQAGASRGARPGAKQPAGKTPPREKTPAAEAAIDWQKSLSPTGRETRLGQALRQALVDERGSPLAGVVVFTDGGQNAGPSPESAVELAREARVPIFPVGVGSDQRPANVRVYKLEVLPRVYPGDPYTVTGLIQAQRLGGQSVTVQLLRRDSGPGAPAAPPGTGEVVATEQVILGGDGETVPVKFDLTPTKTGRQTLCLRVVAPKSDHNPGDDLREADVEVVDRKDRVLLLAGGPTREYQFVRTLLFRDSSMTVDVLLQTGQPGMSQEANEILDDFPSTREEMFAYDCVVAFDPNWRELSEGQINLLESWVAEQAGGLIVVAGPIYMGESVSGWTQDPAMDKIRALYPVDFLRHVTVLEATTFTSPDPWPLDFTREGMEAEFLWLGDTATESRQTWSDFSGVFSCQPVRGPKPGATVLARFADPAAAKGGDQPVYMAEQFYGSGRVFYMGSGELWRLRRVETEAYERLYTRLVRHVAQGRLLRQSARGLLMVGQDEYVLGNTVEVRAQLANAQMAPLDAPAVSLELFLPDGSVRSLSLKADPTRVGTFAGQFAVLQEGAYRLELPIPESDNERLVRRVQVRLPDLEREHPERNDPLLTRIAESSGGKYYPSLDAAIGPKAKIPLLTKLEDRSRTSIQPVAPDRRWEGTWMAWMMGAICGVLCLEWLIRRLSKLA